MHKLLIDITLEIAFSNKFTIVNRHLKIKDLK